MDGVVQAKLVAYVRGGGHAIILPEVPRRSEDGDPCDVLWDAAMQRVGVMPPDPRSSPEAMHMLTTPEGESIVAPGKRWSFDLPDDAQPLVHDTKDGRAVGFSRPIGAGIVTVLGFNLQYVPNEQEDQKDLLERLVTGTGARPLATRASNRRIAAMQLSAASGVFVCLVNPVELPAATRVRCTAPDGAAYTFPQDLDALSFQGAGARLLPVGLHLDAGITLEHSTWELLAIDDAPGGRRLTFATPGEAAGEIRISGAPVARVDRADVQASTPGPATDTVLVLLPRAETCTIEVAVAAATDTRAAGGDR
jgi:hypothetical protein